MDGRGARGWRGSLGGEGLYLVQGPRLPAMANLDHGVGETRPQLGGQLGVVSIKRLRSRRGFSTNLPRRCGCRPSRPC